jgi:hypothetical protein
MGEKIERLEKSDMDTKGKKEAYALSVLAFKAIKKIDAIKLKLALPEAELTAIKEKLKREFSELEMKSLEIPNSGLVTLVDSISAGKLDEKKIAKLLKVKDLKEFKIPGKQFSFIKISPEKVNKKLMD